MEIKDKRKLDTHGPLDMIDPGECFVFAKDEFDTDVWIKTDDEKSDGSISCTNLNYGSSEWFHGEKRVTIVNIHAVILDEQIENK